MLLFLGLGMQEVLVISVVALVFFGGKKIPELMSGLGQGVKSFRDAMNGDAKGSNGKPEGEKPSANAPTNASNGGDAK